MSEERQEKMATDSKSIRHWHKYHDKLVKILGCGVMDEDVIAAVSKLVKAAKAEPNPVPPDQMENVKDRFWIASYTASEKHPSVLCRGIYFRSIHDSKEDAESIYRDERAADFTVTEYMRVAAPPAPSVSADFETWWKGGSVTKLINHLEGQDDPMECFRVLSQAAWNASKAAVPAPIAAPSVSADDVIPLHSVWAILQKIGNDDPTKADLVEAAQEAIEKLEASYQPDYLAAVPAPIAAPSASRDWTQPHLRALNYINNCELDAVPVSIDLLRKILDVADQAGEGGDKPVQLIHTRCPTCHLLDDCEC